MSSIAKTEIKSILKKYLYNNEKNNIDSLLGNICPEILEQNKSIESNHKIFICKLQNSSLNTPFETIYEKYNDQMGPLAKDPSKTYEADIYLGIGAKRAYAYNYSFTNNYDYLLQIDSSKEILSPPTNGSVLHIYHFPPDDHWIADVKEQDVQAYFSAFQESNLSLYSRGKHPYYQKSKSLEFCIILKGEITLILDKEDVYLRQGDTVVQKGSNHAWSNHSNEECILAISSHSGEGV
jgi:hypothetical protein